MSSARQSFGTSHPSVERRGLRVTNWPLRDAPLSSIAVLVSCILIGIVAGFLSRSVSMGVLSGLATTLVMWKLWVPLTTEFEPRGIVLSVFNRRRRISWREIDHLELRGAGVFVCSTSMPAQRAVLEGFFLPWGPDRETISTFCDEYRPLDTHQ